MASSLCYCIKNKRRAKQRFPVQPTYTGINLLLAHWFRLSRIRLAQRNDLSLELRTTQSPFRTCSMARTSTCLAATPGIITTIGVCSRRKRSLGRLDTAFSSERQLYTPNITISTKTQSRQCDMIQRVDATPLPPACSLPPIFLIFSSRKSGMIVIVSFWNSWRE